MKQNGKKRSISWKKLIGILLFLSLLFSIGYAVACMIRSPSVAPPGDPHAKVKSD